MDVTSELRAYWDEDAATYDRAPSHGTSTPTERAAWNAALSNGLPPPPARILDVGAGTGFLTLAVAALGHRVTALDLSPGMLAKLERKVADAGLEVEVVTAPADRPPAGPFDAVMERHLLWTLPSPADALAAWRAVAPEGRLLLFEGLWGEVDPIERRRQQLRELARRLRRAPAAHHRHYEAHVRDALPLGRGSHPDAVIDLVEASGWRHPEIVRLRDVEWARALATPAPERLVGPTPVYVVTAR